MTGVQTCALPILTPAERRDPRLLNGSRRARIAKGSGRQVSEVNNLVDRFAQAQKAMKMVRSGGSIPGMPPLPKNINSHMGAFGQIPKMANQSNSNPNKGKKRSKSGNPAKRAAEEGR